MKAIMISIKPKWCAKIMNGEKTIEVRKNMPKCDLPIDVYIYCTKEEELFYNTVSGKRHYITAKNRKIKRLSNGMVVAKFTLNKVEEIKYSPTSDWYFAIKKGIINETTMGDAKICKNACLSHGELSLYLKGKNGYAIHISDLEIFDKPKELSEFRQYGYEWFVPMEHAPQNYCYIETEN